MEPVQDNIGLEPEDVRVDDSDEVGYSSYDAPHPDDLEGVADIFGQSVAGDLDGDEDETATASSGQNVDLAELTDEELAELVAANPQAVRNQAMMQSRFTRESQRLKQEQAQLQTERDELSRMRGGVETLLQRAGIEIPANGNEGPLRAAMSQRVQQAAFQPQQQPATPETPAGTPATLEEWGDQIVEKAVAAVTQELKPLQEAQQRAEIERYHRDNDMRFAELARNNPEIADVTGQRVKPELRRRIEKEMIDTQNFFDPAATYYKLREPMLRKRRQAAIAQSAEERKEKPSTKPTRSTTRGKAKALSSEEKTAATFAYARAHPQDFIVAEEK